MGQLGRGVWKQTLAPALPELPEPPGTQPQPGDTSEEEDGGADRKAHKLPEADDAALEAEDDIDTEDQPLRQGALIEKVP